MTSLWDTTTDDMCFTAAQAIKEWRKELLVTSSEGSVGIFSDSLQRSRLISSCVWEEWGQFISTDYAKCLNAAVTI